MNKEALQSVKEQYASVIKRTEKRLKIWIGWRMIASIIGAMCFLSLVPYYGMAILASIFTLVFSVVIAVVFGIGVKNGVHILMWLLTIGGIVRTLANVGSLMNGNLSAGGSILYTIYYICSFADGVIQSVVGVLILKDKEYRAYADALRQRK